MNTFKKMSFNILYSLPLSVRRRLLYLRTYGRLPNLKEPAKFSEKMQWRIINDRRRHIGLAGDKLEMKRYAAVICPQVNIPETLWSGDDPRDIEDVEWNCEWVMKPIAGAGHVTFGAGAVASNPEAIERVLAAPIEDLKLRAEWLGAQASGGFLLEAKLPSLDAEAPPEYKFWTFHGRVEMIYFRVPDEYGVTEGHRYYDRDWESLDLRKSDVKVVDDVQRPARLKEMIAIAEELAAEFDFVRVDLYDTPRGIFFGELTPYPTRGLQRFDPPEADKLLGDMWTLPRIDDVR